jgi:starch phosphorylase
VPAACARRSAPGGRQIDASNSWELERWVEPLGAKIAVRIEGREVWVRPWLHLLMGGTGYLMPILLL